MVLCQSSGPCAPFLENGFRAVGASLRSLAARSPPSPAFPTEHECSWGLTSSLAFGTFLSAVYVVAMLVGVMMPHFGLT